MQYKYTIKKSLDLDLRRWWSVEQAAAMVTMEKAGVGHVGARGGLASHCSSSWRQSLDMCVRVHCLGDCLVHVGAAALWSKLGA